MVPRRHIAATLLITTMISQIAGFGCRRESGETDARPAPVPATLPAVEASGRAASPTRGPRPAATTIAHVDEVAVPAPNSIGIAVATSRPASLPEGPLPFLPLGDAQVGEWARYTALDERTVRYEIIEIVGNVVTSEIRVTQGGKPLGLPTKRGDRVDNDPQAMAAERVDASQTVSDTTIDAAGRSWQATLYEDRWVDEEIPYLRRTWVSEEAPVFGLLRMELYGGDRLEARMGLAGYGARSPAKN